MNFVKNRGLLSKFYFDCWQVGWTQFVLFYCIFFDSYRGGSSKSRFFVLNIFWRWTMFSSYNTIKAFLFYINNRPISLIQPIVLKFVRFFLFCSFSTSLLCSFLDRQTQFVPKSVTLCNTSFGHSVWMKSFSCLSDHFTPEIRL